MTSRHHPYRVWSSLRGGYFNGIVNSHLVAPDSDKTLCGKPRGRMYADRWSFDERDDCKICAKRYKAAQLEPAKPVEFVEQGLGVQA